MPRSRSRSFGIHDPLGDALVLAERAGLLQELVDEGRLAVVDVGDDGDVAKLHGGSLSSAKTPALGPGGAIRCSAISHRG